MFCKCNNIEIKTTSQVIPSYPGPISAPIGASWNGLQLDCVEFFKEAVGPIDDVEIVMQQQALIQRILFEKWNVNRCINCDVFVFAMDNTGKYLLNGNLLRSSSNCDFQTCDNYSMPYKIVLKQLDAFGSSNAISDDSRVKQLHQTLLDYVKCEAFVADEEIRKFTELKMAELREKRARATKEYQQLVSLISNIDQNIILHPSTNLIENVAQMAGNGHLDTPPVTPDSTGPMSIDNSPSGLGQALFAKKVPPTHAGVAASDKIKRMATKHSAVLSSQVKATKAFQFVDDIFDMEGMQPQEPDKYHNNLSDGELDLNSDTEENYDKSDGVCIPRHASKQSLNIARSMPISMPMMCLRNEEELEDEPENNVDIAASIKALAKSVHGDTVFGDMPTRARFTTQI